MSQAVTTLPKPRVFGVHDGDLSDILSTYHLADLRSSGLTDETIRQYGFYTEWDLSVIAKMQGWKHIRDTGSAMVIPYLGPTGVFSGFARIKPTLPPVGKDGTRAKYLQPLGVPNRPFFSISAAIQIHTSLASLLLTEGEKKCLAAEQCGVPAIGLCGWWGWQKGRKKKADTRELIDDLADINWRGRIVALCPDTDPRRNPNVNQGMCELARVLSEHGADVRFMHLPIQGRDNAGIPLKMGVDDWILAIDDAKGATYDTGTAQIPTPV